MEENKLGENINNANGTEPNSVPDAFKKDAPVANQGAPSEGAPFTPAKFTPPAMPAQVQQPNPEEVEVVQDAEPVTGATPNFGASGSGFNPFVQSTTEFRKAEDNYFEQIKELERAKREEEDRIKISKVEEEAMKREQEIAEREAKLRLQKEEMERREQEIRQIEETRRQKEEAERRAKQAVIDEENKRKAEQAERLRKLEEEEAIQKRKLQELEKLEKESELYLREIVPNNPDKMIIEQEKKNAQKNTKMSGAKKPSKLRKVFVALIVVAVIAVAAVVVVPMLKPAPQKQILSVDLTLENSTFFEGDEILDIENKAKNFLTVNYDDGSKEIVGLTYEMISSDFIIKNDEKTFVDLIEGLTESENRQFTVLYKGLTITKDVAIYGIEKLGDSFELWFPNGDTFSEFDYVSFKDIHVMALLPDDMATLTDSTEKRLTELQYNLLIINGSEDLLLEKTNEYFCLPSLLNLGKTSSSASFTYKVALAGVGEEFEQPEITKTGTLQKTVVKQLQASVTDSEIYSLDVYETPLIEDPTKCMKDFKAQLYNILEKGIFAQMDNASLSVVKLGYAYHYEGDEDDDTDDKDYEVKITKEGENYTISLIEFTDTTDARLFFTIAELVPNVEKNTVELAISMLGTSSTMSSWIRAKSFSVQSIYTNVPVTIKKDTIVSAKILTENIKYLGPIVVGQVIDLATIPEFIVEYTLVSGVKIVYDNQTSQILKINGEDKVVDMSGSDLSIRIYVPSPNDTTINASEKTYHNNGVNYIFGYQSNGIGRQIKIYLTCGLYSGGGAMFYIETEQILQEA